MVNSRYFRNKRIQKRLVFRRKRKRGPRSRSKQFITGTLYLVCGLYILLFTNLISRIETYNELIKYVWAETIIAYNSIYVITTTIASMFLVILLILVGILMTLGGFWRLLRIAPLIHKNTTKQESSRSSRN